jgi:hypothetical protein
MKIEQMKGQGRNIFSRLGIPLLLIFTSIGVTFLAGEVALRVILALDRNYLEQLGTPRERGKGVEFALGDIIRLNPNDSIVYELRPRMKGTFTGKPVTINSMGMRDVERSVQKAPGTFRIVCLGDSHMFGWGVKQEETFPAVLEMILNERYQEPVFEVWNMGVPGYNGVMEVEVFHQKALPLDPDMVIINYVHNDMDLPNFLTLPPNVLTLKKSYLWELIERRLRFFLGRYVPPMDMIQAPWDARRGRFVVDPEVVPLRFNHLAGWDNMVEAYRRLARTAKSAGIVPVMAITWADYRGRIRHNRKEALPQNVLELKNLCRKEGYVVVDAQDRIVRYLKKNDLVASSLWLSSKDNHMNPLHHSLMAREIIRILEREGILEGTESGKGSLPDFPSPP